MPTFYLYDAAAKRHINGKTGQPLTYACPDTAWQAAADLNEGNAHMSLMATTCPPGTPVSDMEPYYE